MLASHPQKPTAISSVIASTNPSTGLSRTRGTTIDHAAHVGRLLIGVGPSGLQPGYYQLGNS
jgi:hypothetical protein